MKERIKKTKFSFNDLMFRIPGILIFLACGSAEVALRVTKNPSEIVLPGEITLPTFMLFSGVGLIMFLGPYILMALDIYREWKNPTASLRLTKKQNTEDGNA
ncbi:hypothetical protein [Leptospira stimsonii]|uniref:Uncharacterized protein n=1 Tax=Leptospira stimsonii TaxID=2202203 RepID=A0ABY2N5R4_9LEPT|nr:hypothetical protein [Leptospira stimsonii]TGK10340.1 hypothetical protein EHO98_22770 [Leptospira stimsonii]TGM17257.1 hypothetical protein EHQ90_07695 [Leptospira stimsonii]